MREGDCSECIIALRANRILLMPRFSGMIIELVVVILIVSVAGTVRMVWYVSIVVGENGLETLCNCAFVLKVDSDSKKCHKCYCENER